MTDIQWRPEFSTGVADVDHEHQQLIEWINRTLAAMRQEQAGADDVTELLGEVFARISAHFALEERVMRERAYDQFAEHKQDHERLLDEIRDIMDEHEFSEAADHLVERLSAWFGVHFRTHDARFHRALPPG